MITKPDYVEISRRHGVGREVYLREVGEATERFLAEHAPRESWDQRLLQHCQCCGEWPAVVQARGIIRCHRHIGRNPCSIEGCGRTTKAQGDGRAFWYSNDDQMCGQHWRQLIPPGSPERRVYNRLFRLEKKLGGWTEELEARYWRVWARIVAIARARAAGDLDEAEINRLMGWDE